jgi:hypothetical protein
MDRLMTLVYDELRAVARRQLRRFRPGQTAGRAEREAELGEKRGTYPPFSHDRPLSLLEDGTGGFRKRSAVLVAS